MYFTYSRFWWHLEKCGNWERSLILINSFCKLFEMRKVLIRSVRKCLVLPSTRIFSRLWTEPQKTANELDVKMPLLIGHQASRRNNFLVGECSVLI